MRMLSTLIILITFERQPMEHDQGYQDAQDHQQAHADHLPAALWYTFVSEALSRFRIVETPSSYLVDFPASA